MRTKEPAVTNTFTAEVKVNKRRIAAQDSDREVRELVLEIEDPGFTCEAGQSIGIYAPPIRSDEQEHLRWYSIADAPERDDRRRPTISICVRRIVTTDPVSGTVQRGLASNYLCDRQTGDVLKLTGPRGVPFTIPPNPDATVICIGTGTGLAPFRHFLKSLARQHPNWKGVVRLFYGTQNGLDVLYANNPDTDWEQYFDDETFALMQRLSPPPNWADPIGWDLAYSERGDELIRLLERPDTYVYVAGLKSIGERLDKLFGKLMGSANAWQLCKQELVAGGRWTELLY